MDVDHRRLQALVDEGAIEELLGIISVDVVTDTWLRYHATESHPDDADEDPHWWAVELWLSAEWWADEQRVRDGLLRLVEAADQEALGVVAAGPLEVFVSDNASRLHWIEQQAALSEKFRRALTQVWAWDLPAASLVRLDQAAGTPLPRPDR